MQTTTACAIVRPGQGEAIWALGEKLTFKLGPDLTNGEFVVHELLAFPRNGPPPHRHHFEDEMFLVIDGDFDFLLPDRSFRCARGDAVYLPKNTPHTYVNIGGGPGHLLVTCAPSGFERFIKAWGQPVAHKTETQPPITPADVDRLVAIAPQFGVEVNPEIRLSPETSSLPRGSAWWVFNHFVDVKLTANETCGKFSVAEVTSKPGCSVPSHFHRVMDEYFYMTDGEMEFLIEDRTERVGPGTLVFVPHGVPHGFENVSGGPARFFDVHTPGGFETFFEEAGTPARDVNCPPIPEPAIDPERLSALMLRHGMELADFLVPAWQEANR